MKMALSARSQEGNIVVINQFELPAIKTKEFVQIMANFKFNDCLIVTDEVNEVVGLSARNAVGFNVLPVAGLNVYDILKHSKLMLVQSSLSKLEERLAI